MGNSNKHNKLCKVLLGLVHSKLNALYIHKNGKSVSAHKQKGPSSPPSVILKMEKSTTVTSDLIVWIPLRSGCMLNTTSRPPPPFLYIY